MKTFLSITTLSAALLMFVSSCKDKPEEEKPQHWTVHAKVENAEEFSNVVEVRLMAGNTVLARSDFKDGSFTIELPEMVPQNYLRPFRDRHVLFSGFIWPSTMSINNESVKALRGDFRGFDKEDNHIVDFLILKEFEPEYFNYVNHLGYLVYVDSHLIALDSDRIAIVAKKGWNILYTSRNVVTGRIQISTTTPVDGMKWHGFFPATPQFTE